MNMVGDDLARYRYRWTLICDFCGRKIYSRKHDFRVGEFDTIFCKSCYVDSMAKRNQKKQAKIIENTQNKWLGDQLDEEVKKQIAKSLKSNERKVKIN